MLDFAERTGLAPEGAAPRRYLWTDAFAVANFLGLARATGDERFARLGLDLIGQVHHVLGRYRPDDQRSGFISGLVGGDAESHPTRGGLRIGKDLPERKPRETFDEFLEWNRDGQYFHYLTRWMHALDLASRQTKDPRPNLWARELAETAHEAFVYGGAKPGERRMFWKMSTDLSRPLVPSMGHHDPLDGLVTCMELDATARSFAPVAQGPTLKPWIADFRSMVRPTELPTADALGIGGLLTDAYRVARLTAIGALPEALLLDALLAAALEGLYGLTERGAFVGPPGQRIAFRELGLAIGLHAADLVEAEVDAAPSRFAGATSIRSRLEGLRRYEIVGSNIESFWVRPEHQRDANWAEHRDINEVMLATCIAPNGYLMDGSDETRLEVRPLA